MVEVNLVKVNDTPALAGQYLVELVRRTLKWLQSCSFPTDDSSYHSPVQLKLSQVVSSVLPQLRFCVFL